MKKRIILFIALPLIVCAAAFGLYSRSRQEKVVIEAFYMQYACGDDNIDMRIEKIDRPEFQILIDKDVAPFVGFIRQQRLIDFVDKCILQSYNNKEEYLERFIIEGRINIDDAHEGCGDAIKIYVDKISYGKNTRNSF